MDNGMAGGIHTQFAKDGSEFFSYNSRDLRVHSFSTETGQHTGPYLTHRSPVSHIVQSPEGRLLLTAESDNRVSLWHLDRYLPVAASNAMKTQLVSLNFAPNGRMALAAKKTGEMQIWPLPPVEGSLIPECFLRFAEGFGRWRLTSENVLQMVDYETFDEARREVLALPEDPQDPQRVWLKWLASDPDKRTEWPE
jgi:WD40 repeat protein